MQTNRKIRSRTVGRALVLVVATAISLAARVGPWGTGDAQGDAYAANNVLQGDAYAIDGDTLRVGAAHVRLQGVAAPERGQHGGPQATEYMKRLVNGKAVRCVLDGTRSHDRLVGVCYLNEQDVGASVISAGLARDCPRFSKGRYASAETAASRMLFFPNYCRPR